MLSKNLLAVAAAVVPALAQEDSDSGSMPNLTALIGSDDRLSTLGTILESYPDVASTLASAENVTVFAPTNDAFMMYLDEAGLSLDDVTEEQVAAILNYHVAPGMIMAANISETPQYPPTLLNSSTYTNVTGGQVVTARLDGEDALIVSGLKSEATVVEPDLMFTGGVAHIIDSVNVIPTNVSSTASAANLTLFLSALASANLTSTIEGLEDVTIFAPTNEAFQNIGNLVGNLSSEALTSILQYHVIEGTIAYSASLGNGSVETLGGDVNLTVADSAVFVGQARVVNADVLIANGVLHVIDSVLNPNGTIMADPESDEPVEGFESASSVASVYLPTVVPAGSTTVTELVTQTPDVASGFSTQSGGAVGTNAGGADAESTSEEVAAMATGAVGMVALFGGAALMANM